MTLLFCDGFDHYAFDDILKKWDQMTATTLYADIGSAYARGGVGQGLWMKDHDHNDLKKTLNGNYQTIILGFAIYISAGTFTDSTTYGIIKFLDGGTNQLLVRINSSGYLQILSGSTVLGTSSSQVSKGVWYYLEVKVKIDQTAGSIELRLDGAVEINESSIDTQASSNAYCNSMQLSGGYADIEVYIDDLYICDTSGTKNNDFLGDVVIKTLYPASDGTHKDFTPSTGTDHYALVDEPQMDDTDYNEGDAAGEIDTFNMGTLGAVNTILGIQAVNISKNSGVGTVTGAAMCRSGATPADNVGDSIPVASGATKAVSHIWEQEPTDAVDWTTAKVNAAEFGVKMVS